MSDSISEDNATPISVHPRSVNVIVKAAVLEAHRRLADPRCRQIFSEFRDAAGSPLQAKLDSIGQTGQSYLAWIWFRDGEAHGSCVKAEVLAFTTPGSRVVCFCGEQFTRQINRRGLGLLATTILHEELHSLGLGEDPPSSWEITRRVEARCGS